MQYSFLCTLVVVICGFWVASVPTGAEPPDDIKFYQSFESIAEVNYYHLNISVGVYESRDPDGPYYRLRNQDSDHNEENVFDFKEGELHTFLDYNCTTTPLTNTSHSHIFGLSVLNKERSSLISAFGVLNSYSRFNPVYLGQEVVRGIDCQCYGGTAMIEEAGGNITAQYCWSSNDWISEGLFFSKPVSIELIGNFSELYNSSGEGLLHIEIHFHSFIQGLSNYNEPFQTRVNVYCRGRKFSPVPELPSYLNYHQESFADNPMVQWVTNGKVIYDKVLKLVRYEYRETSNEQPPFYAQGSMSVIHDFNTGVAYYQDIVLGNCTIRPIQADLFDAKNMSIQNITGIPLVELRSPSELLRMDANFSFVGKKMLRGIPTHYYIGLKEVSFPWLNDMMINATLGIHFLDPDVREVAVGRGVDIDVNVPLQLVIKAYNDPNMQDSSYMYQETYNFFNFDAEDTTDGKPDIGETPAWAYDVRQCYSSLEEKHVRIVFSGPRFADFLRNESALFPVFAVEGIRKAVGGRLTALRIQHPEVDYNDTHIYLTFTILPPPKPESQFVRIKSRSYSLPTQYNTEVSSMEECLEACANNKEFPCQAVNYCSSTTLCQMSNKIVSLEDSVYVEDCEMGTRTVPSNGPESDVEYVTKTLMEEIERGTLIVKLPTPKIGEVKIFTAVEFVDDIYRKSKSDSRLFPIVGDNLKQFTETRGKSIQATRLLLGEILADECARQCLNDASSNGCAAFNYLYKSGTCALSYFDAEVNKDKVFNSTEAYLFTRNYLSRFTAQKKAFTTSSIQTVNDDGDIVENENACAKKCLAYASQKGNNGKECRSFDLCTRQNAQTKADEKVCFPNENGNKGGQGHEKLSCISYSRSDMVDFTKRFNSGNISLEGLKTVSEVSSENCATQCVGQIGVECQGYYFCATKGQLGECGFVKTSEMQKEQPAGRLSCSYNDRIFSPNGKTYAAAPKLQPDGSAGGTTASVAVGLTIFLVILFFVLGGFTIFLGIYFVRKSLGQSTPVADIRMLYLNRGGEASVTQVGP